jgi:hypothetical protein
LGSAAACGVPTEGEAKCRMSCSFSSTSVKKDLAAKGFEMVLTAWKELVGGVGERV